MLNAVSTGAVLGNGFVPTVVVVGASVLLIESRARRIRMCRNDNKPFARNLPSLDIKYVERCLSILLLNAYVSFMEISVFLS